MYTLRIFPAAERELARLDRPVRDRVLARLIWLSEHSDEVEHEALQANLAAFFKFRVGDYRVFYRMDSAAQLIIIEAVRHRREAYR